MVVEHAFNPSTWRHRQSYYTQRNPVFKKSKKKHLNKIIFKKCATFEKMNIIIIDYVIETQSTYVKTQNTVIKILFLCGKVYSPTGDYSVIFVWQRRVYVCSLIILLSSIIGSNTFKPSLVVMATKIRMPMTWILNIC